MKNLKFSAVAAALGAALLVAACAGTSATTANNVQAVLASSQGQSFVTALGAKGNLIPGMNTVLTDVNNGITNAANDLPYVCTALPWADQALDVFGPLGKIDATTIKETDAAVAAFEAGPCKSPPTNVAAAVGQGASMWSQVNGILKNAGVPVATPAATPMPATPTSSS